MPAFQEETILQARHLGLNGHFTMLESVPEQHRFVAMYYMLLRQVMEQPALHLGQGPLRWHFQSSGI